MVRRVLYGIALAAGLTSAVAAQPAVAQTKPIEFNLGVPIANLWPMYVARELKIFDQVGLAANVVEFQSGAPLIAGMKNGSLDVVWTGLATLFMQAQGIPLTYILYPSDTAPQMGFVVNPKSGIESYKDIAKSKAIAAPTATCSEASTVLAARAAGVSRAGLNISNLAPNLMQTALQNGQVDAAFIWGPWSFLLRDAGFKVVNWDPDFGSSCPITVAVRPDFLKANPQFGCRMVKAFKLAVDAGRKNPDIAIGTIQKALNVSYAIAKDTYESNSVPTLEMQVANSGPWTLANKQEGLTQKLFTAAEALREAKSFKGDLPREAIGSSMDDQYIRQFMASDCK